MQEVARFQLNYLKQEKHMMLPGVTPIIVTQNLYDILFQYVITEEKEQQLKEFIKLLETHIKGKAKGPFSQPLSELEFLNEGLQELKLLNWMEIPVSVFEIVLENTLPDQDNYDDEMEKILDHLEKLMTFNRKGNTNIIYVFPAGITCY